MTHVDSVEMIRDGGSLAACFQGSDGGRYWVFFEICTTTVAGRSQRHRYRTPIVLDRTSGQHFAITWRHALSFLDLVETFPLDEHSIRWLRIMREVAKTEGALPASIDPFFGEPNRPQ